MRCADVLVAMIVVPGHGAAVSRWEPRRLAERLEEMTLYLATRRGDQMEAFIRHGPDPRRQGCCIFRETLQPQAESRGPRVLQLLVRPATRAVSQESETSDTTMYAPRLLPK
ncbi:hypothetical protein OH76DRAFT_804331 [Lentinus brumalis]|uniref:Uncharacterized protein n=1 Tax=Lentinus brumalis TaxID=2498619 RepID=A0A371CHA2_9APHY|nr:hypothetical protein OH76DRAFT_638888 [Polyporus brumalis]RDX47063.1 hypothetical protein OH76DRAFT_804331 [Polyporus brumalis]